MISIITPVYNTEEFLKECIESVLSQDCTDWEWILVDDGSTDNSSAVLSDYASKDSRIHVLTQQNRGCASARNRALNEIHGEYVAFLDADDWMEQGTLSRIQEICKTESPDLILWNYRRFINGEYNLSSAPLPRQGMLDKDSLRQYELDLIFFMGKQKRQYAPYLWVRAIKASVIKENGIWFNEDLRRSEDLLFSITVQRYCRTMYVILDPCIVYRMNPSSISHSYVKNYIQGLDQIYTDIIAYANKMDQPEMKKRAAYMYVYRTVFALREEVSYQTFPKVLAAIKNIIKSPYLQESLQEIGPGGMATFGRRYTFLYHKQVLLLYFLLKARKKKTSR